MKIVVVLIYFISISTLGFTQVSLDSFEKMYAEYFSKMFPQTSLTFQRNDKIYTYDKLEPLAKLVLEHFVSSLPRKKMNYNSENLDCKRMAEEILLLPRNKQSYNHFLEVARQFPLTFSAKEKIYFTLYFNDYFSLTIDTTDLIQNAIMECYRITSQQTNIEIRAQCYITIGDFLIKYRFIPASLKAYLHAVYIYEENFYNWELADVYFHIAGLYNNKIDDLFKKDAISYYDRAASNFYIAGDTLNCLYSQILRDGLNLEYGFYNDSSRQKFLINLFYLSLHIYKPEGNKYFPNVYKKYFLLSQIGAYFQMRGDSYSLKVAEAYYNASLIVAINNCEKYNIEDVYDALINLSRIRAHLGKEQPNYFIEVAIGMAMIESDEEKLRDLFLAKANVCLLNNTLDTSIYYVRKYVNYIDSSTSITRVRDYRMKGYINLYWIFQKMGKSDSESHYLKLYKENVAELMNEADDEKSMRSQYDYGRFQQLMTRRDSTINKINNDILYSTNISNRLRDSNFIFKFQLAASDDSLRTARSDKNKVINEIINLTDQKRDLIKDIEKSKKERKELQKLTVFFVVLSVVFMLLFGRGWKFYKAKMVENRKNLENTAALLNAQSKSRVHNLQNNYEKFLFTIRTLGMEAAKTYAMKCASYFRSVLNKWDWDDKRWSLKNEIELMNEFFLTENVLNKDIEIREELNGVDPEETRFESEILTTLLSNSINHGFKNERRKFTFTIRTLVKGNLLIVEVSDNGKPGKIEEYIDASDKESGLKILKRKIETIAKLDLQTKMIEEPFTIEAVTDRGTTIKFILPYENIKNTNS